MRKSSCTVLAALALSVLCATGARAAVPHAPSLPSDVTATECVQGGGVIVISADGDGTGSFTTICRGGVHDGQAIT
ncbi:hypothetical protein BSZ07_02655 [Streptomyces sp. M1013]|uniref:hypothetical protein n=1 Tax=Streptomyces sp. M1013 TaxID=549798 RepID=UPI000978DB7F|nr:hypothetical protein [Streptomyces sp. M1013]OMI91793.1 hypothetical protein BSZ07_02655 [Streptomyces sp. M1013]